MTNLILCGGRVEVVEIIHDKCFIKCIVNLDKNVPKENREEEGQKYILYALDYLGNEGIIKKTNWKCNFTTITISNNA